MGLAWNILRPSGLGLLTLPNNTTQPDLKLPGRSNNRIPWLLRGHPPFQQVRQAAARLHHKPRPDGRADAQIGMPETPSSAVYCPRNIRIKLTRCQFLSSPMIATPGFRNLTTNSPSLRDAGSSCEMLSTPMSPDPGQNPLYIPNAPKCVCRYQNSKPMRLYPKPTEGVKRCESCKSWSWTRSMMSLQAPARPKAAQLFPEAGRSHCNAGPDVARAVPSPQVPTCCDRPRVLSRCHADPLMIACHAPQLSNPPLPHSNANWD
jgi:hypothetical protein